MAYLVKTKSVFFRLDIKNEVLKETIYLKYIAYLVVKPLIFHQV